MKINVLAIAIYTLICGFAAPPASAASLTVTKTADTADGACDADCSLREATIAAAAGDTITFSALFDLPQTVILTGGHLSITKTLTIIGPGSHLMTVNGNQAGRIFHISGGPVVQLSGMALKNGKVTAIDDHSGGAIYLLGSSLTLTKMLLSGNTARGTGPLTEGEGGGIYSLNSSLSLIDTQVNNNLAARNGSGIFCSGGPLSLTGSTIFNNEEGAIYGYQATSISIVNSTINSNLSHASPQEERVRPAIQGPQNGPLLLINSEISGNSDYGLALAFETTIVDSVIRGNCCIAGGLGGAGTTTITRTTISSNTTNLSSGGGVRNNGTMTINDSTISNNRSWSVGGGIDNTGKLSLTNSTISGNVADSGLAQYGTGGGISTSGSASILNLTNSTITDNFSRWAGGGLSQTDSSVVNIRNTIIGGNRSTTDRSDVAGTMVSQGFNLIGTPTGSSGWAASDILNRSPGLGPLANNGGPTQTHAVTATSLAVNAGNNSLAVDPSTGIALTADQRGFARFIEVVDIGAYESVFTVAYVAFGGRVFAPGGHGIENARITLTDSGGSVIFAHSNPFGYFRFAGISPGAYTVSVTHKRFLFGPPQIVSVSRTMADMRLVAQ